MKMEKEGEQNRVMKDKERNGCKKVKKEEEPN